MFVTTFKTVSEDDQTVIKSQNTKITQKENFVVEEVLSDDDAAHVENIQPTDVQIEEVFDDGKYILSKYYKTQSMQSEYLLYYIITKLQIFIDFILSC